MVWLSIVLFIVSVGVFVYSVIDLVHRRKEGVEWSNLRMILLLIALGMSSVVMIAVIVVLIQRGSSSPSSPSLPSLPSLPSRHVYLSRVTPEQASDLQSELVSEWEALQERKRHSHCHAWKLYQQEEDLLDQLEQLYQHDLFRGIPEFAHALKAYHLIHNQHFASFPSHTRLSIAREHLL